MFKYLVLISIFIVTSYAGLTGDWCGTIPALEEARNGRTRARPILSGTVEYINRPMFRVHYTRSGADRVSQTYAESTASALSYIWAKMIDTLGWIAPAPDYGQGGDDRFDCYITHLASGIAGVCYSENSYSNPYPDGTCAHIRISNSLDLASGVKVVTCHEFNHASQMRYSAQEQSWWYENTATWIEDLVYDDINDYVHYLTASPNPFNNPELPITTFSGLYQYAGALWPMFLNDFYDYDCPRKIWHYQGTISGQNTLSGINYVLTNQYSSNLAAALEKYALWRYFTNYRADTVNYFKEGHLYPLVRSQYIVSDYPASGLTSTLLPSGPGGCNYIQFLNGGGKLFVMFDGQDGYQWKCYLAGYDLNQNVVYNLNLNSQMQASDSCDWQDYNQFSMIPVISQWQGSANNVNYSFTANIRLLYDIGIVSLTGFPQYTDSGFVTNPVAVVKNYGLYNEIFPIKLTVGDFYTSTYNINLYAGDSIVVNFAPCTLKTRGYVSYACSVYTNIDERAFNNNLNNRVFVRVKDVSATAIVVPGPSINHGCYLQPVVRLKNNGNLREVFDVDISIGGWQATQAFGLGAGLEIEFQFDSVWYACDTGWFAVKCSTKLDYDVIPNNNRIVSNCIVYANAVTESGELTDIHLPSIIVGNHKIRLNKNFDFKNSKLCIFNINGVQVLSQQVQEKIEIRLPTGCYIIVIKSNNNYLTRKAVIIN